MPINIIKPNHFIYPIFSYPTTGRISLYLESTKSVYVYLARKGTENTINFGEVSPPSNDVISLGNVISINNPSISLPPLWILTMEWELVIANMKKNQIQLPLVISDPDKDIKDLAAVYYQVTFL